MRARNLKPSFFVNEALAEIEPLGRLLFQGLWCMADREGRLEDRPSKIKVSVLPYDRCDIERLLNSLQDHGFIIRYTSGNHYIQILKFTKHQQPHYKEIPSVIPPPKGHSDSDYIGGGVPESVRLAVITKAGRCKNCGSKKDLTIDHITPRVLGGSNDEQNLQCLCRKCNSSKNNRILKQNQSCANVDPMLGRPYPLNPPSPILNPESLLPRGAFESVWGLYPRKLGKDEALKFFKVQVKTPEDYVSIQKALTNFIADLRKNGTAEEYIPHGSTWFNKRWKDWINYNGAVLPPQQKAAPRFRKPEIVPPDPSAAEIKEMHDQKVKDLGVCRVKECAFCAQGEPVK